MKIICHRCRYLFFLLKKHSPYAHHCRCCESSSKFVSLFIQRISSARFGRRLSYKCNRSFLMCRSDIPYSLVPSIFSRSFSLTLFLRWYLSISLLFLSNRSPPVRRICTSENLETLSHCIKLPTCCALCVFHSSDVMSAHSQRSIFCVACNSKVFPLLTYIGLCT